VSAEGSMPESGQIFIDDFDIPKCTASMSIVTFQYRIKDPTSGKHLMQMAHAVNRVWNYCNEISLFALRIRLLILACMPTPSKKSARNTPPVVSTTNPACPGVPGSGRWGGFRLQPMVSVWQATPWSLVAHPIASGTLVPSQAHSKKAASPKTPVDAGTSICTVRLPTARSRWAASRSGLIWGAWSRARAWRCLQCAAGENALVEIGL
jgi:hypothetical protein